MSVSCLNYILVIRTFSFALLEGGRNCAALNLSAVHVTSSFDPIHFLSSWPVFQEQLHFPLQILSVICKSAKSILARN